MMDETIHTASAPAKAILLGEHAVVYGQPALAIPLSDIRAHAAVTTGRPGIRLTATDLGRTLSLCSAQQDPGDLALYTAVHSALRFLNLDPACVGLDISVHSDIPIASGLGSGAAVSTAIIRALFAWQKRPAFAEEVSVLVYQSEIVLHSKPSGLDNTVVAREEPVLFARGTGFEPVLIGQPLHLIIAHTGIASKTRDTVLAVQQAWQSQRKEYEACFRAIGSLVTEAATCLESGDIPTLGRLMTENHRLLRHLDVSSPELDRLVQTATGAGALGAKLSGGGRGGIMIALAQPEDMRGIRQALEQAGASQLLETHVPAKGAAA